jgi:AcrR family transcriptional regulator
MAPEPPDVETLLGPYPPRDVRSALRQIGERIAEYLRALMPTLHHVLANPDLGRDRLVNLHRRLVFHPLLAALTDRFRRLRDDGLVAKVEPSASARAFLAVVHASVLSEIMTHRALDGRHRAEVGALVEVLWAGLAPDGASRNKRASRGGRPPP